MFKNYAEEYQAAIEYGKGQLPAGEEFKAMVIGVEEFSMMQKFLRQYVFGWLVNMLSKQPRTYGVVYSDNTLVVMGFKQTMVTMSYEPEFHFVKPLSSVKVKKGLGKYSLFTEDKDGKKLELTISGFGDTKKDLEYLAELAIAE